MSSKESQPIQSESHAQWKDYHYELQITGDGSPTLRRNLTEDQVIREGVFLGESMHHMGGAWSETAQIYGSIVQEAFQSTKGEKVKVLSVGLGLGYNELMICTLALKFEVLVENLKIFSFETESCLKDFFCGYVQGSLKNGEIRRTYTEVLRFCSEHFQIKSDDILEYARKLMKHNAFILQNDFSDKNRQFEKAQVILYDAYSSKTNQELWNEDFLIRSIQDWAAPNCLLSTYACTGALKRALAANDFQFFKKDGFQGKRNSSLGRKGIFKISQGQTS